jgi:hypothetical protein
VRFQPVANLGESMRVSIVSCKVTENFQEKINEKICDLLDDEEMTKIVDIKFWCDTVDPVWNYAAILWELKDV